MLWRAVLDVNLGLRFGIQWLCGNDTLANVHSVIGSSMATPSFPVREKHFLSGGGGNDTDHRGS